MAGPDVSFVPGMDVGPASDTPSGVGLVEAGFGVNSSVPGLASQGQTTNTVISGTDRNTPKGPPIFRWNKYDFMYNAYFGLGGFYDGSALYKSQVEKDDQFTERRATTHYRNFVRQIIDATYVPVFSSGASRHTEVNGKLDEDGKAAPLWNDMLENVDNRHRSIQTFTKKIVRHSRILGVSFVVVDNFSNAANGGTVTEIIKSRLYPYCYMRLPQQVEPSLVKLDDFCRIQSIVFKEAPAKVRDEKTKEMVEEKRWKLWNAEYSVVLKRDEKTNAFVEVSGTKFSHNLGETPVFAVMSSEVEDDTVLPHPDFYNVAKSNWALYNIDSAQMRLIRSQMFAILCLPATDSSEPDAKQAVHPLQGFRLPTNTADATHALPMYLAPPIGPYSELAQTVKDLSDDIFRQAGQEGVKGVQKAASGVAKAYDFQAQEYVLKETAKIAKYCEEEIARLFKKYVPSEQFDYEVHYEDCYRPTDVDSTVKLYTDYIDLDPGPLARALALEQATRAVFDDLDDEEVQPVIEDIRKHAKDEVKTRDTIPPVQDELLTPQQIADGIAKGELDKDGKPIKPEPDNLPPEPKPKKLVKKAPKRGYSVKNAKVQ